MNEIERAFLDELLELTKKYKLEVGGCGCCGSPWLLPVSDVLPGARYELSGRQYEGFSLVNEKPE